MKEVVVRFLSGVLYVSIILFSLFMSREWYIGLLFILAVITLNEFLKLISLKGIIAYIILVLSFYFLSYKEINSTLILILGNCTCTFSCVCTCIVFYVQDNGNMQHMLVHPVKHECINLLSCSSFNFNFV